MPRRRRMPPALLVLVEGLGVAPASPSNGVSQARFPYLGSLGLVYPHRTIEAAGPALGLAECEPAAFAGGMRAILSGAPLDEEGADPLGLFRALDEAGLRTLFVSGQNADAKPFAEALDAAGLAVCEQVPGDALSVSARVALAAARRDADIVVAVLDDVEQARAFGSPARVAEACERVDDAVSRMTPAFMATGGFALVTATHGGGEAADPVSATDAPVWLFVAHPDARTSDVEEGSLVDVAPTFLGLLGVPAPRSMMGTPLAQVPGH